MTGRLGGAGLPDDDVESLKVRLSHGTSAPGCRPDMKSRSGSPRRSQQVIQAAAAGGDPDATLLQRSRLQAHDCAGAPRMRPILGADGQLPHSARWVLRWAALSAAMARHLDAVFRLDACAAAMKCALRCVISWISAVVAAVRSCRALHRIISTSTGARSSPLGVRS